jgi:hypothetical protein
VENKGYNDLWRLSRLNWLDSTTGLLMNTVSNIFLGRDFTNPLKPYEDVIVSGNVIYILEKKIIISDNGLPDKISVRGNPVLDGPLEFRLLRGNQTIPTTITSKMQYTQVTPLIAVWKATSRYQRLAVCIYLEEL